MRRINEPSSGRRTAIRDEAIKIIADVIERECWANVDGEIMDSYAAAENAIDGIEQMGFKIVKIVKKRKSPAVISDD